MPYRARTALRRVYGAFGPVHCAQVSAGDIVPGVLVFEGCSNGDMSGTDDVTGGACSDADGLHRLDEDSIARALLVRRRRGAVTRRTATSKP